jgi:hypothetical protein
VDENPTLSEAVFAAVSDWLGNDGLATGFLLVVPTMDSDGTQSLRVCTPDTQPYHTSLGLVGFAEEFIRDDIRTAFLADLGPDD